MEFETSYIAGMALALSAAALSLSLYMYWKARPLWRLSKLKLF